MTGSPEEYMGDLTELIDTCIDDKGQPYLLLLPHGNTFYITTNITQEVLRELPLFEFVSKLASERDRLNNKGNLH